MSIPISFLTNLQSSAYSTLLLFIMLFNYLKCLRLCMRPLVVADSFSFSLCVFFSVFSDLSASNLVVLKLPYSSSSFLFASLSCSREYTIYCMFLQKSLGQVIRSSVFSSKKQIVFNEKTFTSVWIFL